MTLLYDGQCPFCRRYARYSGSRLGERITLLDAREQPGLVGELRAAGCDIDEGMTLLVEGQVLQGRQAVAAVEAMGGGRAVAARLALTPGALRAVYPLVKLARRVVLRMLGRDPRIPG